MIDHFGILASVYDRAIPFTRVEFMRQIVNLPTEGYLLDAAGGTGRVAVELGKYAKRTFVADISRGMLAQSFAKGLAGIEAPAEMLPFCAEAFERIIIVDALHHVNDQAKVMAELWRVLKKGGVFVIEEPDINKWQVKILAVVEKLALMRSHFLSPSQIVTLLPVDAHVEFIYDGFNAWIVARKVS